MNNPIFTTESITVYHDNAFTILAQLAPNSIQMILTDPPYFLEKLDQRWNNQRIKNDITKGQQVRNLPSGMKFSPLQSVQFGKFFASLAAEAFRILVPGGFFLSFSQGRLYQRMAVASEDAGFWIRDMLSWRYTRGAQAKAFSLQHFVKRNKNLHKSEKIRLLKLLDNRKTPQLTPAFEPVMLAQKPIEETFIHNFDKWGVGLIDGSIRIDDRLPSTMFTVEKPSKRDRTIHPTQKPVLLLEHFLRIFSQPGQTVLDPFMGSGTTAIAALRTNRLCIGIEQDTEYIAIVKKRINTEFANTA